MVAVIKGGDGVAGEWVEMQCPVSRQVWGFLLGDMVTDADGLHTHTIMTHCTPGVLHTAIFSMTARKVRTPTARRPHCPFSGSLHVDY